LFDIFNKEVDGVAKTSYAFNLVFQAYDRTLSDVEINGVMARIAEALTKKGLEVR
jgi:phenylalanyl-tRNA synthetase beta subunit